MLICGTNIIVDRSIKHPNSSVHGCIEEKQNIRDVAKRNDYLLLTRLGFVKV